MAQRLVLSFSTFGVGTLLAGLDPGFVISSFSPASVVRWQSGSIGGHLWMRCEMWSFTASFIVVAGTVVAYNQLNHMQNMNLGLNVEKVLTVEGPLGFSGERDLDMALLTFMQELRQRPSIWASPQTLLRKTPWVSTSQNRLLLALKTSG